MVFRLDAIAAFECWVAHLCRGHARRVNLMGTLGLKHVAQRSNALHAFKGTKAGRVYLLCARLLVARKGTRSLLHYLRRRESGRINRLTSRILCHGHLSPGKLGLARRRVSGRVNASIGCLWLLAHASSYLGKDSLRLVLEAGRVELDVCSWHQALGSLGHVGGLGRRCCQPSCVN